MRYAMINNNIVIDILNNQETEPKWPPCLDGSDVIAVKCDETVKIGMVYIPETGKFTEYIHPIKEYIPSQLDRIESMIVKSNNELRQEGADTAILELIKKGIL